MLINYFTFWTRWDHPKQYEEHIQHWSKLCIIHIIILYFFKMRYEHLGKDLIVINNYTLIQLKNAVQHDGTNCGIFCLNVCMCRCEPVVISLVACNCIDGWTVTYLWRNWWKGFAKCWHQKSKIWNRNHFVGNFMWEKFYKYVQLCEVFYCYTHAVDMNDQCKICGCSETSITDVVCQWVRSCMLAK